MISTLFSEQSVHRNPRAGAFARVVTVCALLALVGCAQTPPTPVAVPAPTQSTAPVVAAAPSAVKPSETPPPAPSAAAVTASAPSAPMAMSASTIATTAALTPTGVTRYRCATGKTPNESRVPIELPTGTERICSRFPAMGPCQYERDACRAKGGRVIRFDDVEITKEVEREYDKQVQRFKLNAG
jgi:hypothetical protein